MYGIIILDPIGCFQTSEPQMCVEREHLKASPANIKKRFYKFLLDKILQYLDAESIF
jgi:hypothetical protein